MPVGGAIAGGVASAAVGSLLGGNDGGSQQSGTTQVVQNTAPWSGVQPYLSDIYSKALANYNHYGAAPAFTTDAAYKAAGLAQSNIDSGNPLLTAGRNQIQQTIAGDYLSPDSNPFLKGAVNEALGAATRGVNSQFSGDNFGSSANREWLGRTLANTALPIYAQNYQTERAKQLAAATSAPEAAASQYQDVNQLYNAGNMYQNSFLDPLRAYQQLVAGTPSGGGTSTTSQPYFTNPYANALGMGLGGLSLYNGLNQSGLLNGVFGSSFNPASSYNAAGAFQPYYNGMGAGGYQYG